MTFVETHPRTNTSFVETHPIAIPLADGTRIADQLWMPFASARHPATDRMTVAHRAWLWTHGLVTPRNEVIFDKARFHELAGLVYTVDEDDVTRLAADFIAALFVLDDLMDGASDPVARDTTQARVAVEMVRRATHTGRAPSGPLEGVRAVASAMADLTRRLQQRGGQLDAYVREVDVYLDGVIEETRRRAQGFASVADYAEVRVAFSAVYACVELGLAAYGERLSADDRSLARLANLSVSWVNDVWSWPKERILGERSNLVAVLMDTEGLDEPTAFHRACRLCDELIVSYLAEKNSRSATPTWRLLEGWMRGNLDWHAHGTARYAEGLSVAPCLAA